jgi:hypothetical protein
MARLMSRGTAVWISGPRRARWRPNCTRLIRRHDETGIDASLYGCVGYIIGIDGMDSDERRLNCCWSCIEWQTQDAFVYTHNGSQTC